MCAGMHRWHNSSSARSRMISARAAERSAFAMSPRPSKVTARRSHMSGISGGAWSRTDALPSRIGGFLHQVLDCVRDAPVERGIKPARISEVGILGRLLLGGSELCVCALAHHCKHVVRIRHRCSPGSSCSTPTQTAAVPSPR